MYGGRVSGMKAAGQRGSALVELCLVLPVIIFLMISVLSVGRVLEQFAWLSQTTYQAYLLGSEEWDNSFVPPQPYGKRTNIMKARFELLKRGNQGIARPANFNNIDPAGTDVNDQEIGNELFRVQASGAVETLLGPLRILRMSSTIVGPVLALDPGETSNLAVFENPAELRNCDEIEEIGALDTPCWTCSGPNYTDCGCSGAICTP